MTPQGNQGSVVRPRYKCRKCGLRKGAPAFAFKDGRRGQTCAKCLNKRRKRETPVRVLPWNGARSEVETRVPPPVRPQGLAFELGEALAHKLDEYQRHGPGCLKKGEEPLDLLEPLYEAGRFQEWAHAAAWATWRVSREGREAQ